MERRKLKKGTKIKNILKSKKNKAKKQKINYRQIISTGSTLLDLAILGRRVRGGGVPGGIILEVYGPSASGKTAILSGLAGSAQHNKGQVHFDDPEGRLDKEHAKIYGMKIDRKNYSRSDTVNEVFGKLWEWEPKSKKKINVFAADSIAALSTEMEMEGEDKMGMKKGKDLSAQLRKTCRIIANNNLLLGCSNQERMGPKGTVTTSGKGVPYYASIRIRITPVFKKSKITRTKTLNTKKGSRGKKYKTEKAIGIRSICEVKKNSLDEPFGKAQVSIIFNYGIDDIRDNLEYLKTTYGLDKYPCPDGKQYGTIDPAIRHIENNDLAEELREEVIDRWEEIDQLLTVKRPPKKLR